jgi:hypothetical protein
MSCGHGWHSCGPWSGPPYSRGWYGPPDWYEEADWPIRGRSRRYRRPDPETAAEELETRLEELREEVRRVEAELGHLVRPDHAAAGET